MSVTPITDLIDELSGAGLSISAIRFAVRAVELSAVSHADKAHKPRQLNRTIKKVRVELKESQAAFGQRFGVDQSTIHRWENENPPRGTALKLLEQFFASQGVTSGQA